MLPILVPTLVAFFAILFYGLQRRHSHKTLVKRLEVAVTGSAQETVETARQVRKLNRSPIVHMLGKQIGHKIQSMLPSAKLEQMQASLIQAGMYQIRMNEWVGLKMGLGLALGILLGLYRGLVRLDIQLLVQPLCGIALGFMLPDFWLKQKIKARHNQIKRMLPFTLDLIRICIQAGLDLNGALRRVVSKIDGPLSEEFSRMLYEIKMGKSREAALADLGKRVNLMELSSFITILIQAEKYGMSISKIIDTQADQMRMDRSQRLRTKAAKVPVLMLIPIVVFIFPTMFMVLLGPAIIQMMGLR